MEAGVADALATTQNSVAEGNGDVFCFLRCCDECIKTGQALLRGDKSLML